MSASGPRVTYYTSLHALLAWSIMKHEKTCTVADARLYIFFVSLERRKDIKVHFKEHPPFLSPSQTKIQQSLSRTADGTVCHAALEISESSSATEGKNTGLTLPKPQLNSSLCTCVFDTAKISVGKTQGSPRDVVQKWGLASQKLRGPLSRGRNIHYSPLLAKVEYVLSSSSFELCCPIWTKPQTLL